MRKYGGLKKYPNSLKYPLKNSSSVFTQEIVDTSLLLYGFSLNWILKQIMLNIKIFECWYTSDIWWSNQTSQLNSNSPDTHRLPSQWNFSPLIYPFIMHLVIHSTNTWWIWAMFKILWRKGRSNNEFLVCMRLQAILGNRIDSIELEVREVFLEEVSFAFLGALVSPCVKWW